MPFSSSVKTPTKKAEKNKKTPNSVSEGEGHYRSINEGEGNTPADTWDIHGLVRIHPHGSFLCFHGRWEEKRQTFCEMTNILERGSIFSLRGKLWQRKVMLSDVQRAPLPWIIVCFLNWSQDAPVAFLSCQMTDSIWLKTWIRAKHVFWPQTLHSSEHADVDDDHSIRPTGKLC